MSSEHRKQYQKEWVAKRRAEYVKLHGGLCVKCGSPDDLEFDHEDPETKVDHHIFSWSHERIQAELAKCQLLCRPCHKSKTTEDRFPPRQHGTTTMYRTGCRCALCGDAKRKSRGR